MSGAARRSCLVAIATVWSTLLSCARDSEAPPPEASRDLQLPATFVGTIDCAGCSADGVTLTLLEDGTFRVRRGPGGGEAEPSRTSHGLGRWSEGSPGELILRGVALGAVSLRIAGDSLRAPAVAPGNAQAAFPRVLVRSSALDLVGEVMELRGMMVYFADAARFTECASGVSFPIAPEGDALALERGYLDARGDPGAPVLVAVRASVARRPAMEGPDVDALVVERFIRAWPGVGCDDAVVDRPLEGVDWVLEEIPGAAEAPVGDLTRLRLEREGKGLSGSTGCNRYSGTYDLDGPRLLLRPTAMTRAACATPELASIERDFTEALRLTGSFRVAGERLELLGDAGVVARLRAAS